MFKTLIIFMIFFKCILTQNEDSAEKDRQICRQLAKFTPNLCQIDIANSRCVEQCGNNSGDANKGIAITFPGESSYSGPGNAATGKPIIFPGKNSSSGGKNAASGKPIIFPGENSFSGARNEASALDCGVKLIDDTRRKKKSRKNKKKSLFKRIINGTITEEGEWPWQVLLQHGNESVMKNISFCGGAILSQHFILTAAHCKVPHHDFPQNVYVGEHDRAETKPNEKVHKIKKMILHENFGAASRHDVAIIQLEEPISLEDENKARLCLPDIDHPIGEMQECYVTGWGLIAENGVPSQNLREVRVLRVPRRVCNLPASYNGGVHESSNCAGFIDGAFDACQNDSGGPLSCKVSDTGLWYSTGIVSYGTGCARPDYYGVYADTLYHKEWIVKTILDESDPL